MTIKFKEFITTATDEQRTLILQLKDLLEEEKRIERDINNPLIKERTLMGIKGNIQLLIKKAVSLGMEEIDIIEQNYKYND